MDARSPKEQIIRTAPLLCIEILSPEDTFRRMRSRIQDFLVMGVRQVWIVDPQSRAVIVCTEQAQDVTHSSGAVLTLPDTPIEVNLEEVFAALDED